MLFATIPASLSSSLRAFLQWRCLLLLLVFAPGALFAAGPLPVSMTAERWLARGEATFTADSQFPGGVLNIKKGSAELKDLTFADGTIAFDMYMPDHGILGLRFRQHDRDNAEALYFRPQNGCDRAKDCMQYMPLDHGAFEWDLFPEDEVAAPIHLLAWNHIRIELTGRRMQVYVNQARNPTLQVNNMEGSALAGALSFGGPAKYANLVLTTRQPGIAAAKNSTTSTFLRHWKVSASSVLPTIHDPQLNVPMGIVPKYAAMPSKGAPWKAVTAESKGLVNFSREVGSAKDGSIVSVAWAKTTLVSNREQVKQVQLGWVREVWVYVNGELVFSGRNLEGLPAAKVADERIAIDNGSFRLHLRKGVNEIAIALDDNLPGNTQHYGWGMEVKLNDLAGVSPGPA